MKRQCGLLRHKNIQQLMGRRRIQINPMMQDVFFLCLLLNLEVSAKKESSTVVQNVLSEKEEKDKLSQKEILSAFV